MALVSSRRPPARRRRRSLLAPGWAPRRLLFEPLESRIVLDGGLANAALSNAQQQTLRDGLQGLAAWTDTLSSFNKVGQPLAIIDKSIGQELALRSLLQNRLIAPLTAVPATSSDNLVNLLKGLSSSSPDLTVTVNPASVSGGLLSSAQGDELQFNLVFDAVRTDQVGIDLGSNVRNAGLELDPSTRATLNSDLHFDFTFGVDLTPGLNAAEAFFVRVNALTMGETIHETNVNTPAKVGLLGGQVQGGTLDLAGAVSVTLVNPDADAKGNITLAELQNTNISALAGVSTTANSLSGSLPILATLGSTTFAGSPTATIASTNVFSGSPPDITGNAGFEEIAHFNNISAGDLLTVLDRVAAGLQDIAPSLDVNASLGGIPYVDTQPSDVVDFNALVRRVSRGLYDPVLTAQSPLNLAAGGRLSDNAVFSIRSNDSQTTAVTLLAANQQVGESIVTFFNRSLPPTLIGKITASQISTAQGDQPFFESHRSGDHQTRDPDRRPHEPDHEESGIRAEPVQFAGLQI